jgi:hypothetical protein
MQADVEEYRYSTREIVLMKHVVPVILLVLLVSFQGCGFKRNADRQFGDQHFKTAIALIELHRIRFGSYPQSLTDLKFLGDWDGIALASVSYRRLDEGYELNLVRGWMGRPELEFPPEFWHGLGLRRSNLRPAL